MNYQESMERTKSLKEQIASIQCIEIPTFRDNSIMPRNNFGSKSLNACDEMLDFYSELLIIYRDFNKHHQGASACFELLSFVETCDWRLHYLAVRSIRLISTHTDWLSNEIPDLKTRLKELLQSKIQFAFRNVERILLGLTQVKVEQAQHLGGFELLRSFQSTDVERLQIDEQHYFWLLHTVTFIACTGNLDHAARLAGDAKIFALNRLGDTTRAEKVGQIESDLRRSAQKRHVQRLFNPNKEEDLTDTLHRAMSITLAEERSHRFIPTQQELISRIQNEELKFSDIMLLDELFPTMELFEARADNRKPALKWLFDTLQMRDQNFNDRGELSASSQLFNQYVSELVTMSDLLLSHFVLEVDTKYILDLLAEILPDYDLRLFGLGLKHYYEGQYIEAIHIIIPQFENYIREYLRSRNVNVKRVRKTNYGEALLNHLFENGREDVKGTVGESLFNLVQAYLVNPSNTCFNYRNKFAHGWLSYDKCNDRSLNSMLILLLLKLAINDKEQKNE